MELTSLDSLNLTSDPEATTNTAVLQPQEVVAKFFVLLVGVPVMLVNVATVALVVRYRKKFQPCVLYGAISLGVADATTGLSASLFGIWPDSSAWQSQPFCRGRMMLILASSVASCLTLAFISIERCIAVAKPTMFRVWMTKGRKRTALVTIWIFSLAFGAAVFYEDPENQNSKDECLFFSFAFHFTLKLWVGLVFLSFSVIFIAYCIIIVHLFKRKRQIRDLSSAPSNVLGLSPSDRKSIQTIAMLVLLAAIGPILVACRIVGRWRDGLYNVATEVRFEAYASLLSTALNTFLNPFAYAWQAYNGRICRCLNGNSTP